MQTKSRLKRGRWRSKRRIATIVLAVVLLAVVGLYLYIITRPRLLEVTLDRTITYGGTILITIKNVSKENITFSNSGYDLVFERREGSWPFFTWRHVADYSPSLPEPKVLEPGKNVTLPYKIDKIWDPSFSQSGLYRVGTHGVFAEFTLKWIEE